MTKIARRWYVMNATDNFASWDVKKDEPEVFWTKAAAAKRARQCAMNDPHVGFHVCETVEVFFVETKPVKRVSL